MVFLPADGGEFFLGVVGCGEFRVSSLPRRDDKIVGGIVLMSEIV